MKSTRPVITSVERLEAAFERHVDRVEAGAQAQALGAPVASRCATPADANDHRALLRGVGELPERLDAFRRRDHDDVGHDAEVRDRGKIARALYGAFGYDRRRHRMRGGMDQDRVAVGLRLRDHRRADRAAGAAAVVDDDRLAERGGERIGDDAPEDVDRRAGAERDDRADGSGRPLLRGCDPRQRRCEQVRFHSSCKNVRRDVTFLLLSR